MSFFKVYELVLVFFGRCLEIKLTSVIPPGFFYLDFRFKQRKIINIETDYKMNPG